MFMRNFVLFNKSKFLLSWTNFGSVVKTCLENVPFFQLSMLKAMVVVKREQLLSRKNHF